MKLSSLPQALGIASCKGFPPHFFDTTENQIYVGPLPQPEYYGVDSMMLEEMKPFLAWHADNQERIFDLQKELGLAGMELTFPIAALIVLCFVFVARTVLITHQCSGYC